jgi:hypothetical protein
MNGLIEVTEGKRGRGRPPALRKKVERQQKKVLALGGDAVGLLKNILDKAKEDFKSLEFETDSKGHDRLLKCLSLAEKVSKSILQANGVLPGSGGASTVVTNIFNQQNNQIINPVLQGMLTEHLKRICGPGEAIEVAVDGEIIDAGIV